MSDSYGVRLIAGERRRQVDEEGWTPEHDAHHESGELARAAACYAMPPERRINYPAGTSLEGVPQGWPFDQMYWKPCTYNRIRELVKAGALIAAEIDRLTERR